MIYIHDVPRFEICFPLDILYLIVIITIIWIIITSIGCVLLRKRKKFLFFLVVGSILCLFSLIYSIYRNNIMTIDVTGNGMSKIVTIEKDDRTYINVEYLGEYIKNKLKREQ